MHTNTCYDFSIATERLDGSNSGPIASLLHLHRHRSRTGEHRSSPCLQAFFGSSPLSRKKSSIFLRCAGRVGGTGYPWHYSIIPWLFKIPQLIQALDSFILSCPQVKYQDRNSNSDSTRRRACGTNGAPVATEMATHS
ncbi:hypothetical protein PVAP13_9KG128985 [Panicum virgatum]|uniref:Uncharacterized protein n=1 Tax=Panicum virgatum TaxID=38727 RepID=A0A8T0NEU7_PANVG|nr:hypothetical protein PVAP13_9KG128985 [Panicum virgatum]